jgi:hypothetical protein
MDAFEKIKDTKGEVSLDDLTNYIQENVSRKSLIMNGKSQTPQLNYSNDLQYKWQGIKLN